MVEDPKEFADRIMRTHALVTQNPYIPGEPTPKQLLFLADTRREVLYGGAAGGGKSWSLLAAALMYVHVPGYSALLLRRTIPDLSQPGGLIPMSHQWLTGSEATWNALKKTWTFPSGATLSFGHLEQVNDMYRYQGGEYSFIGWDELTQMPEEPYLYLFSRLRQAQKVSDAGVPLRVRSSANPGGKFHDWVHARFIKTPHPDRYFIPSTYKENPHLDREAYAKALAELNEVTRAQLEDGNWDISQTGNMFSPANIVVTTDRHPENARRCRVWDLATGGEKSDWSVGMLLSYYEGEIRVEHVWREKADPGRLEKAMTAIAAVDGRHVPILIEQERGGAGKLLLRHIRNDVLKGYVVLPQTPTGHKEDRAMLPSALSSQSRLSVVKSTWTTDFLSELSQFPNSKHDDQVDTLSYGTAFLVARGTRKDRPAGEKPAKAQRAPSAPGRMTMRENGRWSVSTPGYLRQGGGR